MLRFDSIRHFDELYSSNFVSWTPAFRSQTLNGPFSPASTPISDFDEIYKFHILLVTSIFKISTIFERKMMKILKISALRLLSVDYIWTVLYVI